MKDERNSDDRLVESLLSSYEAGPRSMHHIGAYELPQQAEVQKCVESFRALLLPGFVGPSLVNGNGNGGGVRTYVREKLDDLQTRLLQQIYRGLHHRCGLSGPDRSVDCSACRAP